MANRKRQIVLRVPVTPGERAIIQQKMAQLGTKNFSAYARKMLIDGYIVHMDTSDIRAQTAELQKIAQNFTDYFQADAHVRADVDSGLVDFLSFKLIRKTHFLRELIDFERQANNDRLSLREEYER